MTEDQSRLGSVRANRGIDRRKFMKSLGAIGISGAGLNTAIGKARATPSRDRVRIVTHRSKGEPVRTKQVPKEWFEQKERARRGQQLLFNRLEESSGVLGVGYGPSNAAVDNYRFFEVRVHVDRSGELMRTFQRRSMECQLPLHAGKNTKTPTTTETTIRFQEALNRIVRRVLPPRLREWTTVAISI